MSGLNLIGHKPSLDDIVMPLIRMLGQPGLSWANRADIANAIGVCERQWRSMEEERQVLNQQQCVGSAIQQKLSDYQNSNSGFGLK
jgi:hypothetical protein